MGRPRIFLGSSAKQAKLLEALTRGLDEVAHVRRRVDRRDGEEST